MTWKHYGILIIDTDGLSSEGTLSKSGRHLLEVMGQISPVMHHGRNKNFTVSGTYVATRQTDKMIHLFLKSGNLSFKTVFPAFNQEILIPKDISLLGILMLIDLQKQYVSVQQKNIHIQSNGEWHTQTITEPAKSDWFKVKASKHEYIQIRELKEQIPLLIGVLNAGLSDSMPLSDCSKRLGILETDLIQPIDIENKQNIKSILSKLVSMHDENDKLVEMLQES